eukprot:536830_1
MQIQIFGNLSKHGVPKKYKKNGDENYKKFAAKAERFAKKLITKEPNLVKYLSFDQMVAIHFWTMDHFYIELNKSLRDGKDDWAAFCGPLSAGLFKLPFIDFTTTKVYSGICLSYSKQQEIQQQRRRIRESAEYDTGSI